MEETKQPEDEHIIKLESTVKDYDELVWARDTGNPYIDTAKISEVDVGGFVIINDIEYEVRMPDRRLINRFKDMRKRVDMKNKILRVTTKEAYSLGDVQEEINKDMLFGLDYDAVRLDELQFNDISQFCWEFYNFFVRRLSIQRAVRRSSGKAE